MRHAAGLLFVAALVSPCAGWTQNADPRGLVWLAQGNERLRAGDHEGAAELLGRAYEVLKDSKILLNLGTSLFHLHRYAEAAGAFDRYLRENVMVGLKAPTEVERMLADLANEIGRLRIVVDTPGATILVNGRDVGNSPLGGPLPVDPGAYEVEAVATSLGRVVKVVEVGAKQEVPVSLRLHAQTEEEEFGLPDGGLTPPVEVKKEVAVDRSHSGQLGALTAGSIEPRLAVTAVRVGLTYGLGRYVEAGVSGILAEQYGVLGALSLYPWPSWRTKPSLVAGVDAVFVDRARPGAHGGVALTFDLTRWLGFFAEAAVQYFPTLPDPYTRTYVVLTAGTQLRIP